MKDTYCEYETIVLKFPLEEVSTSTSMLFTI